MECLLCKSSELIEEEKISRRDLAHLYYPIDILDDIQDEIIVKYKCINCSLTFFDPKNAGGESFYSKLASVYKDWYYTHPGKTEYDYVQKFIFDGQKILDIGAGKGELFKRIQNNVHYLGLELSSESVRQANDENINVVDEDLFVHRNNHLEYYDLVCLFQVMEHLTSIEDFIKAIVDVLKPGGKFCLAVPNNESFIKYVENGYLNLPPHHTILWTEKSIRFLANKMNLTVIDVKEEPLQQVHFDQFIESGIRKYFYKLFFAKPKTIRMESLLGLTGTLLIRVTKLFKIDNFLKKFLINESTKGQSIIVVLQKPY